MYTLCTTTIVGLNWVINAQWFYYAGCRSLHSTNRGFFADRSPLTSGHSKGIFPERVFPLRVVVFSEVASVRGFPSLVSSCEVFLRVRGFSHMCIINVYYSLDFPPLCDSLTCQHQCAMNNVNSSIRGRMVRGRE